MSQSRIPLALRREVIATSPPWCCYCQNQEIVSGIRLTVDHIVAEALGGKTEMANLSLACWDCNMIKGDRLVDMDPLTGNEVRLFHPRLETWATHFCWSDDGVFVIGLTPVGRATIAALKLNRPNLVQSRRRWVTVGWHPPG